MKLICKMCGKEYEKGKFGSGPSNCSTPCRYMRKGKPMLGRPQGRPRLFPAMAPMSKGILLSFLKNHGWIVEEVPGKDDAYVIKRGWMTARVVLHPKARACEWADTVLFHNKTHGRVEVSPACRNRKYVREVPESDPNKPVREYKIASCNKPECKKCAKTDWVRQLCKLDKYEESDVAS
jgi:hypothetical protein